MQHTYQDLATATPNTVLSTPQPTTNSAVLILTDAVVARGQRAWHRIKATAAEQRELWREVGEALLVGRKQNPSNQGFSKWCKEMGFDDMNPRVRSDAMWMAENPAVFQSLENGITHPTALRQYAKEQQNTALLPADLSDIQAESIETIELDERSAEKVAKLSRRAKAGDEGSAIAKRHIEALAKKHNTTVQKLEEAAAVTSPAAYYCFTPAQIEALKEVRESVMATIPELESDGLSREAIAAVFMNVAKMLLNEARQ